MNHDNPNPSAAAPARAPADEAPIVPAQEAREEGRDEVPGASRDNTIHIPENVLENTPLPGEAGVSHTAQFDAAVPEDLRVPWSWIDLIFFLGMGLIGLVVAGAIVVAIAVGVFGASLGEITSPSETPARSMILILSQGVWSGLVLLFFFVLVRARSDTPFWRTMGWRPIHLPGRSALVSGLQCLGGGAMLAVFASFAGRFFGEKEELPIEQMFHSRTTVILLTAFGILVAPLVEETIFRGFLYPIFARRFGVAPGVIATGVLFGAMHTQQLWGGWGQIGLLILVGILLTWVRARTGTVSASYLVHLGYNSLLFLGFFAATGGLRNIPGAR